MLLPGSAAPAAAEETLRIATYDPGLTRRGPGLLLRDILTGADAQVLAAAQVIAAAGADVVVLTGFDHDHGHLALGAFADLLAELGQDYPHLIARAPNSGRSTGADMDGDGRRGGPRDAQGYGWFPGEGGMAVLSRLPLAGAGVREFTALAWPDLPGARLPRGEDGGLFPSAAALSGQRLSSVAHWDVALRLPGCGALHLLTLAATPPVFDGPEDRNGLRNHDETALWLRYLEGALPQPPPDAPVVVIGKVNVDPADGEGQRGALEALLAHPRLRDPRPRGPGGALAADPGHAGDPAADTADWNGADDDPPGPGNLRVDYILPDAGLDVVGAGVLWPVPDDPLAAAVDAASRHRLVWVDIRLPADMPADMPAVAAGPSDRPGRPRLDRSGPGR